MAALNVSVSDFTVARKVIIKFCKTQTIFSPARINILCSLRKLLHLSGRLRPHTDRLQRFCKTKILFTFMETPQNVS